MAVLRDGASGVPQLSKTQQDLDEEKRKKAALLGQAARQVLLGANTVYEKAQRGEPLFPQPSPSVQETVNTGFSPRSATDSKPSGRLSEALIGSEVMPDVLGVGVVPYSQRKPTGKTAQEYQARAAQAIEELKAKRDPSVDSQTVEYFKLKNEMGADPFDARLEAIEALYSVYLKPYEGTGVVWDMMRSPYAVNELEEMLQQAHPKLFRGPLDAKLLEPVMRYNGVDTENPKQVSKAMFSLATFGHLARTANQPLLSSVNDPVFRDQYGNIRMDGAAIGNKWADGTATGDDIFHEFANLLTGGGTPSADKITYDDWLSAVLGSVNAVIGQEQSSIVPTYDAAKYAEVAAAHAWLNKATPKEKADHPEIVQLASGKAGPGESLAALAEKAKIPMWTETVDGQMTEAQAEVARRMGLSAAVTSLAIPLPIGKALSGLKVLAKGIKWAKAGAQAAKVGDEIAQAGAAAENLLAGAVDAAKVAAPVAEAVGRGAKARSVVTAAAAVAGRNVYKAGLLGTKAAIKAPAIGTIMAEMAGGYEDDLAHTMEMFESSSDYANMKTLETAADIYASEDVAASKGVTSTLMDDSVYGQAVLYSESISDLEDPTDVMGAQQELKNKGYAEDMEVNGVWDGDWRREVMRMASDLRRQNVEYQMMLVASGYAKSNWKIDGDMTGDKWQTANTNAESARLRGEEFAENHPKWKAFLDAAGLPLYSHQAWDAKWGAMWQYGKLQGVLSMPIKGAIQIGEGFDALVSAWELEERMDNDDSYQSSVKALREYVATNPPSLEQTNGTPWEVDEIVKALGNNMAFVKWAAESYLKDDEQAQSLYQDYMKQVNRLLDPNLYRGDFVSLAGNMFNCDEKALAKWQADNPDLTFATNIALNVALGYFGPKVWRASKKAVKQGQAVPKTEEGWKSQYIQKEIDRTFAIVEDGDFGGWAKRVGTTDDASKVAKELADNMNGSSEYWLASTEMDALAVKVQEAVRASDGTKEAVAALETTLTKLLPRYEASAIQSLVRKVDAKKMSVDLRALQAEYVGTGKGSSARKTGIENNAKKARAQVEAEIAADPKLSKLTGAARSGTINRRVRDLEADYLRSKSEGARQAFDDSTWQKTQIVEALVNDQVRFGGAFGGKRLTLDKYKEIMQDAWVNKKMDLFPHLVDPVRINPTAMWVIKMQDKISGMHNDNQRMFWSAMTRWAYHAPMFEGTMSAVNSANWIFDSALAASGDIKFASQMRTRFVLVKDEAGMDRIASQIAYRSNLRYDLKKAKDTTMRLERMSQETTAYNRPAAALAPDPTGVKGNRAEYVADNQTGAKAQVVPDTSYEKDAMKLYREVLWAPLKLEQLSGVAKGIARLSNMDRWVLRKVTRPNQYMRQWSVAVGAGTLFFKHALTDSLRTVAEEGVGALTMYQRYSKAVDDAMAECSPEVRNAVLASRKMSHDSEYLFNMGIRKQVWVMDRAFKKPTADTKIERKLAAAKTSGQHKAENGDALRRIAQGEVFRIWDDGVSKGGYEGGQAAVLAWFDTPAGTDFLKRDGHYTRAKAEKEATDEVVSDHALAKRNFIESFVEGCWETFDQKMPLTFTRVREMARNTELLDAKRLSDIVEKNFIEHGENPVLSLPVELNPRTREFWKNPGNIPGWVVGKAMIPNKGNRARVYNKAFAETYAQLRKDGSSPEQAARSASTVAELYTSRVHFDLSNALALEAKYRAYVWFGTKHRLYANYLFRLAAKRPTYAAAALQVGEWLESNGKENEQSGYDKSKIKLSVFGKVMSIAVPPLLWLNEYIQESATVQLADLMFTRAANYTTQALGGKALFDSPYQQFDLGVTRMDPVITTIAAVISSSGVERDEATGEVDPDALHEWLAAKPSSDRRMWNRAINGQMAMAYHRGEDIGIVEAFERAKGGMVTSTLWRTFKVIPVGFGDADMGELDKQVKAYYELKNADERRQFLDDNKGLRFALHIYDDPVEEYAVNEAFDKIDIAWDNAVNKIRAATDDNSILDPGVLNTIMDEYNLTRADLLDDSSDSYNKYFVEYTAGTSTGGDLEEKLGVLFPLVDAHKFLQAGAEPNDAEVKIITDEYDQRLMDTLSQYNLLDELQKPDTSKPLYKVLKNINDEEKEKALRYTDQGAMSYRLATVAKWLERGGKTDVYRLDKFLELVHNDDYVKLLQRGTSGGKPEISSPWLLTMTTDEKVDLGLNATADTQQVWLVWAQMYQQYRDYMDQNKIDSQSTQGKALIQQLKDWSGQLAAENYDWGQEWAFSQLPLYERMQLFGVGDPTNKPNTELRVEAEGWGEFFSITKDLNAEMDAAGFKTLGGQQAGEMSDYYKERIKQLAYKNRYWWKSFSRSFTFSDFGYTWAQDPMDYPTPWPKGAE